MRMGPPDQRLKAAFRGSSAGAVLIAPLPVADARAEAETHPGRGFWPPAGWLLAEGG